MEKICILRFRPTTEPTSGPSSLRHRQDASEWNDTSAASQGFILYDVLIAVLMLKQNKYLYWLALVLAIVDVAAAIHWHYWQDQHSRWEKIMVQLEPHAALKAFPMDDQSHLIHRLLVEKEDLITVVENILRQRNLILSSIKSDSTQHHRYEFDVIGSFSSLVLLLHGSTGQKVFPSRSG